MVSQCLRMACILWIVQAQTARTLFGRPVAVELLIDPGHQIGAAHAAVMARHLSSFSGPVISSPGMTAGFGAALAQRAGNGAVVAGQGRRQVFGNSSHGYKCFDADAFSQALMDAGHGGLVLAA
ncbi:hypothetical protein CAY53_08980 [Desulfobulbus oralis]|uniref:Uncharacterized protein n=1 Tax=Desulfobulbus oralis TaxID=1986146 RepID=A0A2L1GPG8_9BACT|nr:hypothetical protein CAY53_08980 [Desulfobulbus oralis]